MHGIWVTYKEWTLQFGLLIISVLVVIPTSMVSISSLLSVDFHSLCFNDPVFFSEVALISCYLFQESPRPDFNFFFFIFSLQHVGF